jgi:Zn-dependent membrane protease YugP
MFFDPTYFMFMIPAFILVMLARWWVNSTYSKWSQVRNSADVNGMETAQRLKQSANLYDVDINQVAGQLSDHYDPRRKTLNLSAGVAQSPSVASMAIAAHELGHAQQHNQKYGLLGLRTALVPAVNIGSSLGVWVIIIGLMLASILGPEYSQTGITISWLGVGAFSLSVVFALVTLPIEINASSRAKAMLSQSGMIQTHQEREGVNAVLNAAAFTYIAALAASLLQLLYWVFVLMGRGGRRRR